MAMINCPKCNESISSKAKVCPYCNSKLRNGKKKAIIIISVIIVILIAMAVIFKINMIRKKNVRLKKQEKSM